MSGGAFDYYQHKIRDIHESIQQKLDKQGKDKCMGHCLEPWCG